LKPRYLGLTAPIVAFISIIISIILSPGFSFTNNALSDLGVWKNHGIIFNAGLAISGFMIVIFSADMFRRARSPWKSVSASTILVGIFLVFVGVFNENFGKIHFLFSVLFFVSLAFVILLSIFLLIRARQHLSATIFSLLFLCAAASWLLPLIDVVSNVAIPETVSALVGCVWLIWLALDSPLSNL